MNVSSLLSPTAQATLLLTSYFSKASNEAAKPLTNVEWGRFASWLKERSTTPADLLIADPKTLLQDWQDARISTDRIIALLNRGHSLAFAIEKWQRAGLWIVTRSDPEYPKHLKQRLKMDSPPVLFGCGKKSLLNAGGLAVIGSRNTSHADLVFTDQIGAKAASEGVAIVSGGARGVDETAMLGAMKQGGIVIGVMADSLLKAATSSKWRSGLMHDHTVLISPFYPEAGFSIGNAMARNKYIYCMAHSALVIHSGKKGGTLSGAEENLKKSWVPLWVKSTTDTETSNAYLVSKGGHWLPEDIKNLKIHNLITNESAHINQIKKEQQDLFAMPTQSELFTESNDSVELCTDFTETKQNNSPTHVPANNFNAWETNLNTKIPQLSSFNLYELFIIKLRQLAKRPATIDALITGTELNKSQLNTWLKRAEEEGIVKKIKRPVRYQVHYSNTKIL